MVPRPFWCARLAPGRWVDESPPERNRGRRSDRGRIAMEAVPRKTTIREVAQAASVGIGTISRVLNSSSQVSRETRARVLEAIRRLGFRPKAQARRILTRSAGRDSVL